jgi:hypothetical protein
MRDYPISQILVINGPGSFTTLRVVCLVINLYKTLNPSIKLYHITKTDLYHYLIDPSRPQQIYIYIGQRNNLRSYDLSTKQHTMIAKADLRPGFMIDDVSDEYTDSTDRVSLSVRDNMIAAIRNGKVVLANLEDIMEQVDVLHPHYLMEPNISVGK